MSRFVCIPLLSALLFTPAPLSGQTRALVLFVHGIRSTPLVDLADGGERIAAGFGVGSGVALQFGPSTALRLGASRVTTDYQSGTVNPVEWGMSSVTVSGDLLVGWTGSTTFVPYVFVGGGVVHTDPDDGGSEPNTSVAGRLGVGFNVLGSFGALFAEGATAMYRFQGFGFNRFQADLHVNAGMAIAFPF